MWTDIGHNYIKTVQKKSSDTFYIEFGGVNNLHSFPEYKKDINCVIDIEEFDCRPEYVVFSKSEFGNLLCRHIHVLLSPPAIGSSSDQVSCFYGGSSDE